MILPIWSYFYGKVVGALKCLFIVIEVSVMVM